MTEAVARPLLHQVMDRAARHLVPFQVTLELTYRCNLSCQHCYIDLPTTDELSLAEWRDILDQLKAAGTLYLLLTGGEIFARRDFFAIAKEARARGFILMLLTNGTLVTPSMSGQVAALTPLFVGLSLHGSTPSTHDGITGKRGSFDKTLQAVRLLKGEGVAVSLQSVLMNSNVREASGIRSLAEGLGVPLRLGYELVPTKGCRLDPQCHEVGAEELARYVDPAWLRESTRSTSLSGLCKAGRGVCSISANGDVYPCGIMPMKLGNLRQVSFAELWTSNPVHGLRHLRSLQESDLSECVSCRLKVYCRRCIGVSLAETGDLTKPAPSACRFAEVKRHICGGKEV